MGSFLPKYESIAVYVKTQFELSYSIPDVSLEEFMQCCKCSEEQVVELEDSKFWSPSKYIRHKGYAVPIFFKENIKGEVVKDGQVQFDVLLNAFLLLSGVQEKVITKRDSKGRFPFKDSLQHKYSFVKTPVVTIYFELMAKAMLEAGHSCKVLSHEEPIVFTHDIDQVRSGWFDEIIFNLKKPNVKAIVVIMKLLFQKVFGLEDSYMKGLKRMLHIDKSHGVKAISFLMTEKSHSDADYKVSELAKKVSFEGQIIGLHPGLHTYADASEFQNQMKKLSAMFPGSEKLVRQHFLRYDVESTAKIHEDSEVKIDYSLGFVEHIGFRNGICSPFNLFNFEKQQASTVLEVPLFLMEGTLPRYMGMKSWKSKVSAVNEMEKLLQAFNCSFSVLFHNSAFTDGQWRDFDKMYQMMIELTKKKVNKD